MSAGNGAEDVAVGVPPKLKAFQFIEGRPSRMHTCPNDDKENQIVSPKTAQTTTIMDRIQPAGPKNAPASPQKPSFPSTPATRLPLAELIGTADDAENATRSPQRSPGEAIQWHPAQSPRRSIRKSTPATAGRKRTRSISPPPSSSSNAHPSKRIVNDYPSLDLQNLKQTLNPSQTDPAADLWNRYAINTAVRAGDSTLNTALLPNLPFPPSPFSAGESGGNIGGLRRWTSCGVEWPSSKSKSRKTRYVPFEERVDELAEEADQEQKQVSNTVPVKSKIGSLIERLQESLARPLEPEEPKGPSSSSPLPDRNESFRLHSDSSNSPTVSRKKPVDSTLHVDPAQQNVMTLPPAEASDAFKHPVSSGFGSEGLDMNAFDGVETGISHDMQHVNSETSPESKPEVGSEQVCMEDTICANKPFAVNGGNDEDEFDEDLGLSAAEFDNFTAPGASEPVASMVNTHRPQANDEFGDDDLDEECFVAAEIAATQSNPAHAGSPFDSDNHPRPIQRYRIKSVSEAEYIASNNQVSPEKILLLEAEGTKLFKTVTLRQSWYDTRCSKGSYVHVIGQFTKGGECIVDDAQNLIILHPDHLVSTTVIADSFGCMRRAVLQDRVKATNESSAAQVYGTILHEIFQEAMKVNRWDSEWLSETIDNLVQRHIEDLYEVKLSVAQSVDYLQSKMPELQAWAQIFVQAIPKPNALVQDRNSKQATMSIKKLLDVEEHIWSPMYGMKGNIDATLQIIMHDDTGSRNLTVPFEVKTGKNTTNTAHRAQTALYTLLLSDRYDIDIAFGILFYLETSQISRIPAIRHELRHMVMQRNELACYSRERLTLPTMLQNSHTCNRCYAKTPCFSYHKLVEDGDGDTSGLKEKFVGLVKHLKPIHQEFFKKWDDLLTKEEAEVMKFRRELWTMLSFEREKLGRCFSNVVLEPGTDHEEDSASKINRYRYTFRKARETPGFSFNESHITTGDPIVVSDEQGHYALAKGYVSKMQRKFITVAVDRKLRGARVRRPGFDPENNQSFAGIMQVGSSQGGNAESSCDAGSSGAMFYRLDKDEFSNGLATVRNNLIQIMADDVFQSCEIRKLIVEGVEPRFKRISTAYTLSGPQSQASINEDQRTAIDKIMNAEDYALVLGMPGTGKTTTIAHIIRALVAKNKSVLLASYTHTAVDNILLKIRDDGAGILRLGAITKIHPAVREFAMLAAEPKTTIEELEKMYHEPQVVATTCLGISHPIFRERTFDYCIVDEASQITLPVCLGPIRMAKCFVLVGDHYQLPPLVQNREALEGGLDVSLFKLLSEGHPSAVVELQHQYRMNQAIMSLSSTLIYGERLKCGSEEVAQRMLEVPSFNTLSEIHDRFSSGSSDTVPCPSQNDESCWLNLALGESSPPVIFFDTDSLLPASLEVVRGARITNPVEAGLVAQLIHAMLLTGISPESIGAITLYRSQLALIKSQIQYHVTPSQLQSLEVHTTDRFQGRDKDAVIVSCVRSNDRDVVGDLLRDWRRVNVAITRARKKLILIGSKATLAGGDELLAKLIKLCHQNGWVIDLPPNASDEHAHSWPTLPGSSTTCLAPKPIPEARMKAEPKSPSQDETAQRKRKRTDIHEDLETSSPNQRPDSGPASKRYVNRAFKPPAKVGRVTAKAVLGSGSNQLRNKCPMLTDIVNEVLGELE